MTKLCDFKRDTPHDSDIVKNIYLVKRQEHVTNGIGLQLEILLPTKHY